VVYENHNPQHDRAFEDHVYRSEADDEVGWIAWPDDRMRVLNENHSLIAQVRDENQRVLDEVLMELEAVDLR
jgi:hypothetical protein